MSRFYHSHHNCPDLSEFVPRASFESLLQKNALLIDKLISMSTGEEVATVSEQRNVATVLIPANSGQVTLAIPQGFTVADMWGAPLIERLSGSEELGSGNFSVSGNQITYDLVGQSSAAGSHRISQAFSKIS